MPMLPIYSVYGLRVQANRHIPSLVALPATAGVDVQVLLGSVPPWLNETPGAAQEKWYTSHFQDERGEPVLTGWRLAGGDYYRLHYSDDTEFIVNRYGTLVWATWPDGLTLEDTATYLLGPVLGFVLRLRGVICLHASAIAVGDQALALLGPAGAGKSTTAAAFAREGYRVLSDDVVALADCHDHFLIQPGYPHLRLWPKSVEALYGSANDLPRLTPTWDKRYLDLTRNGYQFQQQPLRLAAVYLLSERRPGPLPPFVEPVRARAGLMALVANTYSTYLLDKSMRAQEFELLGRVVDRVPLRQVVAHEDPAFLSKLCKVILDDLQAWTAFPPLAMTGAARES